jgi:3-oxoacyl-[acyl-carrier-protein] synthase II
MQEVWITGIGLVTSLAEGAEANRAALMAGAAPVVDETGFAPFPVHPLVALELDRQIPKKSDQRQMEPWQRAGTYAAGLALDDAGARGCVADMHMIVAAGGGERDIGLDEAVAGEFAARNDPSPPAMNERLMNGLRPTLFLAQLSNLLAGNISLVHGVTGSSRSFMGEELAAADALRIARARLAEGRGGIALVGGAFLATRWDMILLYRPGGAMWQGAWAPLSRRAGGGMVLGSMAAFLVLETAAHATARGARPYARLAAIATGCARREAPGQSRAVLEGLAAALPVGEGPLAVMSGAPGAGTLLAEERDFLAGLGAAAIRTPGSLLGHGVEAAFPAHVALAALALKHGALPPPLDPADRGEAVPARVLVTGLGQWRGEALAALERVEG